MEISSIISLFSAQKEFFLTHNTKDIGYRKRQLQRLKESLIKYESDIYSALYKDLKKSEEEAFFTELGIVLNEIDYFLSHLNSWSQDKAVPTPLYLLPARSMIRYEPYGVCLLIAPFNYPVLLCFLPLIGIIGSGNCAIIKGSELIVETNVVVKKIITESFSPQYIAFVEGDKNLGIHLVRQPFDLIFFTGSSNTGKEIMKLAAENLTPCILELGGKSPCIIDKTADLHLVARRIVWGKFINLGQTCIAPDFLLVHATILDPLVTLIIEEIKKMFGANPHVSPYYGKIVNESAFDRILKLIDREYVVFGGEVDRRNLYISPTVLVNAPLSSQIKKEEIFGPLLPIWPFDSREDIQHFLPSEKPLALYVFGSKDFCEEMMRRFPSGGVGINDVLIQMANKNLPFGGIGHSGVGSYHGYKSFRAFSHERSIVNGSLWLDFVFRYPPYPLFRLIKRVFRL